MEPGRVRRLVGGDASCMSRSMKGRGGGWGRTGCRETSLTRGGSAVGLVELEHKSNVGRESWLSGWSHLVELPVTTGT